MNWADLNQYERAEAKNHVDGYMTGRFHNESDVEYFERAKRRALEKLRHAVERVECMGFRDMYPKAP